MVGPLEAADMTGLPTVADIARHLFPELATGDEMMALVEQRLQRGDTGPAQRPGFYLWDDARRGTHSTATGASAALCAETVISHAVPDNNNNTPMDFGLQRRRANSQALLK